MGKIIHVDFKGKRVLVDTTKSDWWHPLWKAIELERATYSQHYRGLKPDKIYQIDEDKIEVPPMGGWASYIEERHKDSLESMRKLSKEYERDYLESLSKTDNSGDKEPTK